MRTRPTATLLASLALALTLGTAQAGAFTVGSPFRTGARADIDELGRAVVAWPGPAGVRVVTGSRSGGFGAAQALSTTADTGSSPSVAIDDHGDAVVVWENVRSIPAGPCSTCEPGTASNGVFVAVAPAGATFGAAIGLAPPQPGAGGAIRVAGPQLAMSPAGQAIIAWTTLDGAFASRRAPGGAFGAPQQIAPAGFVVHSAAIGATGEAVVASVDGRVVAGPPGGSFGAPQALAGAAQYGPGVLVAADAGGDALAAYPSALGLLVSRRPAGGGWSAPGAIVAPAGSSLRAVALADTGSGVVSYAQSGGRTGVYVALSSPAGTLASEPVSPPDLDADMAFDGTGLDEDAPGDIVVAWDRHDNRANALFGGGGIVQVGVRRAGGAFGAPVTLTAAGAEHIAGDTADVALNARGELLATWTDHVAGQARLSARWFTVGAASPVAVLDAAAVREFTPPPGPPPGHFASVAVQTGTRASRRGLIAVRLNCTSSDHRTCKGTLTLTTIPKPRHRAGRAKFTIGPGATKRVYVQLNKRTLRALLRKRRLELIATAVTSKPTGLVSRSSEEVFALAPKKR
ncbi:MAG TPA: hypothetical protein VL120_02640 [Solirubrobacteraceae bacterium]|nr:hypothetical protein [Solirubrobacteraceae bacterium]